MRVTLAGDAEVGTRSDLAFLFTDAATGRALDDLQPYLAAAGHVVIMREGTATFAHDHADVEDADGKPVFALPRPALRASARRPHHVPYAWALPALGPVPPRGRACDHRSVHGGRSGDEPAARCPKYPYGVF